MGIERDPVVVPVHPDADPRRRIHLLAKTLAENLKRKEQRKRDSA